MQRFVAIDNRCAWPNLTLMPGGDIVANIFNQPCHGDCEGSVECWASVDGGRTWSLRGTPAPGEPTKNRMNVAAGLAANEDLLVFASGWTHRPTRQQYEQNQRANDKESQTLQPWVSRSSDGGRTWSITKSFPQAPEPEMCQVIPFGDVHRAQDGSLCVSGYAAKLSAMHGYNSAYLFRSSDDGKTWGQPSIIGKGNHNETAPLHLGKGRWLAAVRTVQPADMELFASQDDGMSWQFRCSLSMPAQHPGHLLRLADGRVLLTYGNRCRGHYGVDVRISQDEGVTWSPPSGLVSLPQSDLGYPATVQLPQGDLLSAYYCSGSHEHHHYHMGVIRWELRELWP